jgi:hypothetical protein
MMVIQVANKLPGRRKRKKKKRAMRRKKTQFDGREGVKEEKRFVYRIEKKREREQLKAPQSGTGGG